MVQVLDLVLGPVWRVGAVRVAAVLGDAVVERLAKRGVRRGAIDLGAGEGLEARVGDGAGDDGDARNDVTAVELDRVAEDQVVLRPAVHGVAAGAADQDVLAAVAVDGVVAADVQVRHEGVDPARVEDLVAEHVAAPAVAELRDHTA